MRHGRAISFISLLIILIAGCKVGPDYRRPPINAPMAFRGDPTGLTNSLGDMPWWQLFQDETLQTLIRVALTNNYDIRIAVSRVEQARAVLAENRSLYFPQITYQGGAGYGKNVLGSTPFAVGGNASTGFDVAANASWEIDLWGKLRRLNESARAQFLATVEAQRNIRISLISTVAEDYFQLLALDQELQIAYDSTNSFGQSLNIFSMRLRGGVSSRLETASAEAALEAAAATVCFAPNSLKNCCLPTFRPGCPPRFWNAARTFANPSNWFARRTLPLAWPKPTFILN
jgi:multidrug efflux system outer membrane protein